MRGVNRVTLIGNVGADPETRYTQNGSAITTLRLATSDTWTDKQSGQKQERTEWHRVKLFGKLAEVAAEYVKKGRQLYVEGSIRTEKYTDKEGVERLSTDIIANEMQMLGSDRQGGAHGGDTEHRGSDTSHQRDGRERSNGPRQETRAQGGARTPTSPRRAPAREHANGYDSGGDIPF